jgi:hypothetical protein
MPVCRLFLGFAHRVRGVPLEQLSLRTLLPTPTRDAVSLLLDYKHWLEQERGVSPRSQVMPIKAAIVVARFLFHDLSAVRIPKRSCCMHTCIHVCDLICV